MKIPLAMVLAMTLAAGGVVAAEGEGTAAQGLAAREEKGTLVEALNRMPTELWPRLNEAAQVKLERSTWFAERVKGRKATWVMRVVSVGEGRDVGTGELMGELVESPRWAPKNAAGQAVGVSCVVTLGERAVAKGDVVTMTGALEDLGVYVIGTLPPAGRPDLPSVVIRASVVASKAEVVGVKKGE